MRKVTKRSIIYLRTDGRINPDYRKPSLLIKDISVILFMNIHLDPTSDVL